MNRSRKTRIEPFGGHLKKEDLLAALKQVLKKSEGGLNHAQRIRQLSDQGLPPKQIIDVMKKEGHSVSLDLVKRTRAKINLHAKRARALWIREQIFKAHPDLNVGFDPYEELNSEQQIAVKLRHWFQDAIVQSMEQPESDKELVQILLLHIRARKIFIKFYGLTQELGLQCPAWDDVVKTIEAHIEDEDPEIVSFLLVDLQKDHGQESVDAKVARIVEKASQRWPEIGDQPAVRAYVLAKLADDEESIVEALVQLFRSGLEHGQKEEQTAKRRKKRHESQY